ncbi:phosphoinositide 3-kinase adapter protein 1 [Megalops cyprinoides]|uniref:phosphoinositide 3-kinase adapter protein 1 n=1 Tax=Megalops cyprinoides TaxID=118141 RepID=UPI001864B6EE|nr:phosphoinositide 3-kinase adapter protein 1 [Megalops cyprinoides]
MTESVASACRVQCEVLIVHLTEAEEWAKYLQNVLKSSRRFPKKSIVLHVLDPSSALLWQESAAFTGSKCIVLMLSMGFLHLQDDSEVWKTFQRAFHPPNKMVLLFCGVSDCDIPEEFFESWHMWRKLYADDDPAMYISTVQDVISEYERFSCTPCEAGGNEGDVGALTEKGLDVTPEVPTGEPLPPELPSETELQQQDCAVVQQDCAIVQQDCTVVQQDCTVVEENPAVSAGSIHETGLTIQPSRIQCGSQVTIYIILKCKLDNKGKAEVEFSCKDCAPKREAGTFENDYTISVKSPDMPSGSVLASVYLNDSVICSMPVTYYTGMAEVSRYLENIANPLEFMCQAFNITSKSTEALDSLLTNSLKSRIPASGLHLFGVSQVEEENMSSYQRNEELPTLLHFAAKYGLKKLATVLLQCPGALQAYSVVNKYGDYPNNVAEKNGFSDLRQFMDEYVETADMLKSHIKESITQEGDEDVYESMSTASRDILLKYSMNPGCKEDIYESMMELDPECIEDLYEDMEKAQQQSLNPEEAMLRKFFLGKTDRCSDPEEEEEERREEENVENWEEEEDPYNLCNPDEIYDTVDEHASYVPEIINRPPAPIPRPSITAEPEEQKTYISRVFSNNQPLGKETTPMSGGPAPPTLVRNRLSTSTYDPYAGMRTPGQRQLISLQERVKVGAINVDEAVQEFKAWQLDQERRSQSLRFQQENLKRLRDSITRRHKEQGKTELEITAPLQHRPSRGELSLECAVYEPTPRQVTQPTLSAPPSRTIQRGSWQTGSTSSTSSSGSNRLSTLSYSSGAECDFEETVDLNPPPRPPRHVEPPPRVPPRLPERIPENPMRDRYTPCPSRALPQRPPQRALSPPPIPRRTR